MVLSAGGTRCTDSPHTEEPRRRGGAHFSASISFAATGASDVGILWDRCRVRVNTEAASAQSSATGPPCRHGVFDGMSSSQNTAPPLEPGAEELQQLIEMCSRFIIDHLTSLADQPSWDLEGSAPLVQALVANKITPINNR